MFMCPNTSNPFGSNRSASGALPVSHTLHPFGEYLALIIAKHLANVSTSRRAELLICSVSLALSWNKCSRELCSVSSRRPGRVTYSMCSVTAAVSLSSHSLGLTERSWCHWRVLHTHTNMSITLLVKQKYS